MKIITGSEGPDERDAADLFPHTTECKEKMRRANLRQSTSLTCTCPARQGRRNALYVIRRTRRLAYVDAYAKIRHEARQQAEKAAHPAERQAFEEVASWAESLEFGHLGEP